MLVPVQLGHLSPVMLLTFLMMVFFFFFVIYVKYSMFFHNILMFMCSLNSDRLL